jgi:hypothetical protein
LVIELKKEQIKNWGVGEMGICTLGLVQTNLAPFSNSTPS